MTNRSYPMVIIALSEEDGGGFAAYAPDLHGCMSDGSTEQEALSNLKLAIREWCEEMLALGREIPEPGNAARKAHAARIALSKKVEDQDEGLRRIELELADVQRQLASIAERAEAAIDSATSWWEFSELPPAVQAFGSSKKMEPSTH